ncbi:MAG: hypothetical protein DMF53_03360 [Acidobacteria bacterium]|nr:MAG: hypothetical protein DMF53_03360 [Acidobacteriota bacterium]
MSALPLLVAAAVPVLLGLLGSRLAAGLAASRDGALYRATLYVLGGAVVLHLLLTLLDLAGIPWHPLLLVILGIALYVLGWRFLPRGPERMGGRTNFPSGLGWGDGIALFVLAAFTLLALSHWITFSDFVFHWGLKGRRFFVARGVDYTYLARRWNWVIHPDYPNLLPEVYAVTALLAGRFDLSAMMLEASVFFALLLAAAREGLRQGGAGRFTRQAGLALIACAAGAYGIGSLIAGGADWLIALALAAAVPPLLRPPDRAGDLQIGVVAAFAAGSKVEGVPLAAFLVLVQWGRRAWGERRLALGTGLRTGLPVAAVVLPWLWRLRHDHLFQALSSAGPFDPSRAPKILAATLEALRTPSWHGLLWTMFLPPLLLVHRRARPFAVAVTLQILFYFYTYFTSISAIEPRLFVISSFARLGFQIVPASLVVGLVAWGPHSPTPLSQPSTRPSGERGASRCSD